MKMTDGDGVPARGDEFRTTEVVPVPRHREASGHRIGSGQSVGRVRINASNIAVEFDSALPKACTCAGSVNPTSA